MSEDKAWIKRNRRYSAAGIKGGKSVRRMREARARMAAERAVAEASHIPDSGSETEPSR